VFAAAVTRYRALEELREFRSRLYACLARRADALFELTDAVLCADHAVASLVRLCLEPEFTRGHGALYDALLLRGAEDSDGNGGWRHWGCRCGAPGGGVAGVFVSGGTWPMR
jgi:hypothetical protein